MSENNSTHICPHCGQSIPPSDLRSPLLKRIDDVGQNLITTAAFCLYIFLLPYQASKTNQHYFVLSFAAIVLAQVGLVTVLSCDDSPRELRRKVAVEIILSPAIPLFLLLLAIL